MKYYDVLRVGAKTSAPTPVVEDEQIKHVESKIDIILKEIMENKPKEMPSELANSTLKDAEVSEVVDTFCMYHDRFFSQLDLRKRLDPAFIWNIPKDIYNLSHRVRERGETHLLDPLFWFCMYIIADIDYTIGEVVSCMLDSMTEDDIKAIDDNVTLYEDMKLVDEIIEEKCTEVNPEDIIPMDEDHEEKVPEPEDIIPMDEDREDVELGSEQDHVSEAATLILKPIDEEPVDDDGEDPHVVSIDCDVDEYGDDTPTEDYLSTLDQMIENGKGE